MNWTIYGKPQPKERPRVYRGHAITPTRTKNYEAAVRAEWLQANKEIIFGPCAVRLVFYLPIPTSWSKKKQEAAERGELLPTARPDIDNLVKIVLDALNEVAFQDDKQIVELFAAKRYSRTPRTEVRIERLSTDEKQ